MAENPKISFKKEEGLDFTTVLRARVSSYFKDAKISSKANFLMCFKSIFLMGVAVVVYGLLLKFGSIGFGVLFALYGALAFCISIATMNIAHDALHSSYVSPSLGNRLLGFVMDLGGMSSFYWKKEHTVDHHSFTNIADHDADLNVPIVLRLSPEAPYRSFHRFQHLYAPVLYSLNFIHWVYLSDIKRIYSILTNKHSGGPIPSAKEVTFLFCFKFVHMFLFVVTPIIVLALPWWQVVLGYIGFLSVAGIVVTTIFQLAHIVENVAFPVPGEDGKIDNSFLKHQLATTSNFATKSKIIGFLFGGLNFQIEHHIFPHICHTHLYKISPIVRETAREFGLPYYENSSFFKAIRSHFRTLRRFGSGVTSNAS